MQQFSFKKIDFNMLFEKWQPTCVDLNVLNHYGLVTPYGHRYLVNIGSGNALLPGGDTMDQNKQINTIISWMKI